MPQMSPMLWSLLFMFFICLFIFFNLLNYFNYMPTYQNSNNQSTKTFPKNFLIWKW